MKLGYILGATAALALVAGCADGYYGSGPGADFAYYGPDTEFDGYYDGYYGPVYEGYWGNGGAFYYRNNAGGRWRQADAAHVRRDPAPGFNHIHGTVHAASRPNHH